MITNFKYIVIDYSNSLIAEFLKEIFFIPSKIPLNFSLQKEKLKAVP